MQKSRSQCVNSIVQTRSNSIQAQALAVSVAVESLLTRFFPKVGKPDADSISKLELLISHILSWDTDPKLAERAASTIGGFTSARAADRLWQLAKDGVIGEPEREAWRKLRNAAAHANWSRFDNDLQKLLDLTNKVLILLNQLVFNVIGYRGKQTDYGTANWPTVDYPPEAPSRMTDDVTRPGEAGCDVT